MRAWYIYELCDIRRICGICRLCDIYGHVTYVGYVTHTGEGKDDPLIKGGKDRQALGSSGVNFAWGLGFGK